MRPSGENKTKNILIVYFYTQYPPRTTIADHLYSFHRYSGQRCFYLNLAVHDIPESLRRIHFDLIVFHTIFLSTRWFLPTFERALAKARVLKDSAAVKVALPQDEFLRTDVVSDFINEFGIRYVFSVAPPSEWKKIYRTVDFEKVKFYQVLTGYLEDSTLMRIERLSKKLQKRPIDIGYRSWRAEPWLGRHGFLKRQVADLFQERAAAKGLSIDISTLPQDAFVGRAWYKFLLRCKYTIGVEGGASLLDWDGTIRERTNAYIAAHPQASFEEVEAACFPGLDGSLNLFAISPRHLEACATKTCQVLVEGEYNGVLTTGAHYIGLKRDFSNIEQVLELIRKDSLRATLTENAYKDVVQSGHYTYQYFVNRIVGDSLQGAVFKELSHFEEIGTWIVWRWTQLADILGWVKVALKFVPYPIQRRLVAILPESLVSRLRSWKRSVESRA